MTHRLWIHDPEARAALAEIVLRPPERRRFRYRFGETDRRYSAQGCPAVHCLRRVRERYLAAADGEDYARQYDFGVDEAIERSLAARLEAAE